MQVKSKAEYERDVSRSRGQRMRWWHEARYGMFVHWGLYTVIVLEFAAPPIHKNWTETPALTVGG